MLDVVVAEVSEESEAAPAPPHPSSWKPSARRYMTLHRSKPHNAGARGASKKTEFTPLVP